MGVLCANDDLMLLSCPQLMCMADEIVREATGGRGILPLTVQCLAICVFVTKLSACFYCSEFMRWCLVWFGVVKFDTFGRDFCVQFSAGFSFYLRRV